MNSNNILILLCLIGLLFLSCDLQNTGDDVIVSQYGETKSHNAGQDCLSCHSNSEVDLVSFSIAGTVYKIDQLSPYPNILLNIYDLNSEDTDFPLEAIEVDGNGNFYTNIPLNWNTEHRITITSAYESKSKIILSYMESCNGCHGLTISRLNLN